MASKQRIYTRTFGINSERALLVLVSLPLALAAASVRPSLGADPPLEGPWLTAAQIEKQGPVSVDWTDTPLGDGLRSLSKSQRLAILLDRRLDPGRHVNLDLTAVPLAEIGQRIANRLGLGAAQVGPLLYIGPKEAASQLRTLIALRAAEAQRLPAAAKRAALASHQTDWPRLATPKDILQQLAAEASVKIEGLDQVPHDLWTDGALPAMPWVDRLSIVALEFDLTFRFETGGRTITLVPIPEDVILERSYPAGRTGTTEHWRRLAPDAEIVKEGSRIVVRGRVEDHERLTARQPAASGSGRPGTQVYTLAARDVALEEFLNQLSEKLALQFDYDREALAAAGAGPNRRIVVEVTGATLDELLTATFKPLGLSFERKDKVVRVSPAPK
ncbi:MAG: hypothetical protein HYX69_08340 [Planctomycetia bacterium]|nr:hypothetical protein [Planctomycetia bacterium]